MSVSILLPSPVSDLKPSLKDLLAMVAVVVRCLTHSTLTQHNTTPQVSVSQRVEGTPAVIVSAAYGYSANMERIMKAQTLSDSKQMGLLAGHRSMEINPRHPIVHELNKKVQDCSAL